MTKLIWLDSSERNIHLSAVFGSEGDWLANTSLAIAEATHVFVHVTDFVGGEHERIEAFKNAVASIDVNKKPVPLIVVYSGDPATEEEEIRNSVEKLIPNFVPVQYAFRIHRHSLPDVERLRVHLEAKTQEESDKAVIILHQEKDVGSAINLVAEVVAWLSVTQRSSPPKMKDFRTNLIEKFGKNGEQLVKELTKVLMDKVDDGIKNRVIQTAEEMKTNRIEAWKRAGML